MTEPPIRTECETWVYKVNSCHLKKGTDLARVYSKDSFAFNLKGSNICSGSYQRTQSMSISCSPYDCLGL